MKSQDAVESELRYWEGTLKGLRSSGRAPQDKIIEAKTWVKTLQWVLTESSEEKSKIGDNPSSNSSFSE